MSREASPHRPTAMPVGRAGVPVVAVALGCAVIAGLFGWSRADTVMANATVVVNPLAGNPYSTQGRGDDLVNLVTEAELVRSDVVVALVQADLESEETVDQLRRGLEVRVPPNSQILEIAYEASTGDDAAGRAQSFATQYLINRQNRAEALIASQLEVISEQIQDRSAELADLAKRLAATTSRSGEATVLEAELESVGAQINQLRARASDVEATPVNPGQIVTPARVMPPSPLSSWYVLAVVGFIVGLLLASGVAVLLARHRNRIKGAGDVSLMDAKVLGEVSAVETLDVEAAAFAAPRGARPSKAFRDLRINLLASEPRRPLVALVATASTRQGRPLTPIPLVLSLSASRQRTALVDTLGWTLRDRDFSGHSTLEEVLIQDADPSSALIDLFPRTKLIATDNPGILTDSVLTPQMDRFIDRLSTDRDVVLIAAGSIHEPRTRAVADSCDVIIVEVAVGVATHDEMAEIETGMSGIADKVLGVIFVNDLDQIDTLATESRRSRRRPSMSAALRTPDG